MNQPTYACPWYSFRFNIVAFGVIGHRLASQFEDSLGAALMRRAAFTAQGAEDVRVYDTVDGEFY